jgi:hypothetical protein
MDRKRKLDCAIPCSWLGRQSGTDEMVVYYISYFSLPNRLFFMLASVKQELNSSVTSCDEMVVYYISYFSLPNRLFFMLASVKQELNSSVTSCDKARRGGKIH